MGSGEPGGLLATRQAVSVSDGRLVQQRLQGRGGLERLRRGGIVEHLLEGLVDARSLGGLRHGVLAQEVLVDLRRFLLAPG